MSAWFGRILMLAGSCFALTAPANAGISETNWYGRMTELWAPAQTGFMRDWLICGEFPNPPRDGIEVFDHTEPCVGCDTDYLFEHGGETGIRPVNGMAHTRPDGSQATWFEFKARDNVIDLIAALDGRSNKSVVAYAYSTVVCEKEGLARLAVGSDDGIMVWVNGVLVHRNITGRAVVADNDVIPVELNAGTNHILLKIEQGEFGWGFCARLLDDSDVIHAFRPEFKPYVTSSIDANPLVVKTDVMVVPDGKVQVDVMNAGGSLIASTNVVRGNNASFNTESWPDGAYDIRCVMPFGLERPRVAYFPWFKGNPNDAVAKLYEQAANADMTTPRGAITAMLADLVRDRMGDATNEMNHELFGRIHSALIEFEELEQEASGRGSRVHPSGFIRLAYRDEVDDSIQFCRVYLPHDFDPSRKWPVVIYLHGYNPENPRYVKWWAIDQRHADRCDKYGVIYIEPHGRGNTGYRGIGEKDVLHSLDEVCEQLPMDEDRIYLTGESMGGGGTWHMGTRNPQRFAALCPIYGGWDYRAGMDEEEYENLTSYQRFQRDSWSSLSHTPALLTTPVFTHHGVEDNIVDVNNTRFFVRELQRWQYDIRYGEYPHGNHFTGMNHWDHLMPWLLNQRLNRYPNEVRVRSYSLKDASAHWVHVEQIADFHAPIHVYARLVATNTIQLDTENVLAIRLSPSGPAIDAGRPLQIMWNNKLHSINLKDGSLELRAEGYNPEGLVKKPELCGPISDVKTTPFALVVGTSSTNQNMNIMCERIADTISADWQQWQKVWPRRFSDTEITDDDLAKYSLILIGDAEANAVSRQMDDQVPLQIDGSIVQLDGQKVNAPDSAVQIVYPNPWNPDRYVHIIAATSVKGMFNHQAIADDLDYCVSDGKYSVATNEPPLEKLYVLAGTFDGHWRVSDTARFIGDPDVRSACLDPVFPSRFEPTSDNDVLHLNELAEQNNLGCFQWIRRNVNANGNPIMLDGKIYATGICVYPWSDPGSAEWMLGGEGWLRLTGVIGVEYAEADKITDRDRENTRVIFKVIGDGKELYVSKPFMYGDPPVGLNVSVASVTSLTLFVHNEAPWSDAPVSADWAEVRLER